MAQEQSSEISAFNFYTDIEETKPMSSLPSPSLNWISAFKGKLV